MTLKKKKGSSMIAVLLIFAILTIVGVSMLSLTVSDYQMRVASSKKTQSLYASDSGINDVYGLIKNIVFQAIEKGNQAAETEMNNFNNDPHNTKYTEGITGLFSETKLKNELNNQFQSAYKAYVTEHIKQGTRDIEDGIFVDVLSGINVSLYTDIFNWKYYY